jgi:hypothetical protein
MGFKEFWNRLTSGDKVERVREELEADRREQPKDLPDYQELRDDVKIEERFGRPMSDDDR